MWSASSVDLHKTVLVFFRILFPAPSRSMMDASDLQTVFVAMVVLSSMGYLSDGRAIARRPFALGLPKLGRLADGQEQDCAN